MAVESLTLIADLTNRGSRPAISRLPSAGDRLTPISSALASPIGRLYYRAYEPGQACATEWEAIEDIANSLAGGYGPLLPSASPCLWSADQVIAAILTVECAPWDDVPNCPFVIELFTAQDHRRKGLAECLLDQAMSAATRAGHSRIALRVRADNTAARTLYAKLGFTPYCG